MKYCAVLAFLVVTLAPLHAVDVVSISGSILTEQEFEEGRFRVQSGPMSMKDIYLAFGVSRQDYVLDCQPGSTNFLVLRPRDGGNTNLSTIVILQNRDLSTRYLRNWTDHPLPHAFDHEMSLSGLETAPPLFRNFRGTALGRIALSRPGEGVVRATYEVMGSSSTYLLKFRFRLERKPGPPAGVQ